MVPNTGCNIIIMSSLSMSYWRVANIDVCGYNSVCLLCSLVRRHASLTEDVSGVTTGRPRPPTESAVKSGDLDTQSETDAVNVRHEDYGTTGTTSLQVSRYSSSSKRAHAGKLCVLYWIHTYIDCVSGHFLGFLVQSVTPTFILRASCPVSRKLFMLFKHNDQPCLSQSFCLSSSTGLWTMLAKIITNIDADTFCWKHEWYWYRYRHKIICSTLATEIYWQYSTLQY